MADAAETKCCGTNQSHQNSTPTKQLDVCSRTCVVWVRALLALLLLAVHLSVVALVVSHIEAPAAQHVYNTQLQQAAHTRANFVTQLQASLFNNTKFMLYVDSEYSQRLLSHLEESSDDFAEQLEEAVAQVQWDWPHSLLYTAALAFGCGLQGVQQPAHVHSTLLLSLSSPVGFVLAAVLVYYVAKSCCWYVVRCRARVVLVVLAAVAVVWLTLLLVYVLCFAVLYGLSCVQSVCLVLMSVCLLPIDCRLLVMAEPGGNGTTLAVDALVAHRQSVAALVLLVPVHYVLVTIMLILVGTKWSHRISVFAKYMLNGDDYYMNSDSRMDDRCSKIKRRMQQCSPISEVARAFDEDERRRLLARQVDANREDERTWLAEVRHYDEPLTPTEVLPRTRKQ